MSARAWPRPSHHPEHAEELYLSVSLSVSLSLSVQMSRADVVTTCLPTRTLRCTGSIRLRLFALLVVNVAGISDLTLRPNVPHSPAEAREHFHEATP